MLERELKLFIPVTQQTAVSATLALLQTRGAMRLAAQYFDTSTECLAHQGAALRLRLEGDQWVQTLKIRGQDELSHIEYNHPLEQAALDLSLYDNTPASALFKNLKGPLELRYRTDVQRTTATLKQGETAIELALDLGVIVAKNNELPISEIEFELKSGAMSEVFKVAARWLEQFNLSLELRSKSERGALLYHYGLTEPKQRLRGSKAALAIATQPYRLPPPTKPAHLEIPELYYQGANRFLSQIIRNALFLASADEIQAPKALQASYLSLLRVGMRRLRSCRQLFKTWLSDEEKELTIPLRNYYQAFGLWRDSDMLWLEIQPKLITAGLPINKKPDSSKNKKDSAQRLAASTDFQLFLLHNLASLVLNQALVLPKQQNAAEQQLIERLNHWFKRIQQRSARFDQLSPKQQHNLRNAIKRLRYCLEILGYNSQDTIYAMLDQAQDRLGQLCDAYVARDWYESNGSQAQKHLAADWFEQKIQKHQRKSKQTLLLLQEQCLSITGHSN